MLSAKEAALEAWKEKARQHGEGDFQGLDDDFDEWWEKEFGAPSSSAATDRTEAEVRRILDLWDGGCGRSLGELCVGDPGLLAACESKLRSRMNAEVGS